MKILEKFVAQKDEMRQWMCKTNVVGNYAYATNGQILVRKKLKGNLIESTEITEDNKAHFIKYFNDFKVSSFLDEDILSKLLEYKTEIIYYKYEVECDECNNSGVVEYKYEYNGNEYSIDGECPACNGKCGTMVNYNKVIGHKYPSDLIVEINDEYFKPAYIDLILSTFGTVEYEILNNKMLFKRKFYEGIVLSVNRGVMDNILKLV